MAKKEPKEDIAVEQEVVESKYSKEELLASASAFGVMPEVIAGALHLAGKDEMTRKEAEDAIKRFLERKCV